MEYRKRSKRKPILFKKNKDSDNENEVKFLQSKIKTLTNDNEVLNSRLFNAEAMISTLISQMECFRHSEQQMLDHMNAMHVLGSWMPLYCDAGSDPVKQGRLLFQASIKGSWQVVSFLCQRASPYIHQLADSVDTLGRSLLCIACDQKAPLDIILVITEGMDLSYKSVMDKYGNTPLMYACCGSSKPGRYVAIVRYLLEDMPLSYRAIHNKCNDTALLIAARYNQVEIIRELLRDMPTSFRMAEGQDGNSALTWACTYRNVEMIEILIEGTDLTNFFVNRGGENALNLIGDVVFPFTLITLAWDNIHMLWALTKSATLGTVTATASLILAERIRKLGLIMRTEQTLFSLLFRLWLLEPHDNTEEEDEEEINKNDCNDCHGDYDSCVLSPMSIGDMINDAEIQESQSKKPNIKPDFARHEIVVWATLIWNNTHDDANKSIAADLMSSSPSLIHGLPPQRSRSSSIVSSSSLYTERPSQSHIDNSSVVVSSGSEEAAFGSSRHPSFLPEIAHSFASSRDSRVISSQLPAMEHLHIRDESNSNTTLLPNTHTHTHHHHHSHRGNISNATMAVMANEEDDEDDEMGIVDRPPITSNHNNDNDNNNDDNEEVQERATDLDMDSYDDMMPFSL
eukprot:TRINITY_DN434_c0_g1_i1.p1 TRINITY_DN434_c0_g1~~TRINITY_DN434_c0_g1_i1.p1  ORF type:complete len:627 (-),score=163.23 TRINITY_DN434_c0_g1_i1:1261-3141(-)